MDANRQRWNQAQQKLRRAFAAADQGKTIELFLAQHAMVHSQQMSQAASWSFEDEVLRGMTEQQIRSLPAGSEHSVAWILFHIARIEDITMNMLVAGTPQLFTRESWSKELKVTALHSANGMDDPSIAALSTKIDINALQGYRQSVGRRTRQIVRKLRPEELHQKVSESRLKRIMDEGALLPEAIGVLNYWSRRTIAGLLLMPPTRHNFLHLNEALRLRQRLRRPTGVS